VKLYRSTRPAPRSTAPRPDLEERSWVAPPIPWVLGTPTAAGTTVTPETAVRNAAAFACIRVLTSTVASLPVDVVRELANRRQQVRPLPKIVRRPSSSVRRRGFMAQTMRALTTRGNAYWLIADNDAAALGRPDVMESLASRSVTWAKDPNTGTLVPSINGEVEKLWPVGHLVHIPASLFLADGSPVADSPVELAAQSIGTGIAAEEFGARYFGDGGHPQVVARIKQDLSEEQAQTIKARIKASWVGREPAVVGSGIELDWPKADHDSQFLDLLRFEVEQACRFWGVPPIMAYAAVSGSSVTYANATDADLAYLKHSVGIWIADVEDAWSELLPAPQVVKVNTNAILRLSPKDRHALYGERLNAKTMTINEVRALEDEDPFDGDEFDEPGIPGGSSGPPPAAPPTDPPAPPEED
jgi:HK97 family phage portal protein